LGTPNELRENEMRYYLGINGHVAMSFANPVEALAERDAIKANRGAGTKVAILRDVDSDAAQRRLDAMVGKK
jgi:hypothetical protein